MISTVPIPPAGLIAMICVSLDTVTLGEPIFPNPTEVAPVKPLPVIVTVAPAEPFFGLTPVTVGRPVVAAYVNWSAGVGADEPNGVTTVTSTVPAPPGLTVVICVSLFTVALGAPVVPKPIDVAPENPVPVMVTVVPAGPEVGLIPVITGTAAELPYVN